MKDIMKNDDNWLDLKATCKYCSLSASTLRRVIYKGEIKVSKVTGKLLFKRSWIDDYLSKGLEL